MSYQILIKGKNIIVKEQLIFSVVYKLLADKDFESMTIELIE